MSSRKKQGERYAVSTFCENDYSILGGDFHILPLLVLACLENNVEKVGPTNR